MKKLPLKKHIDIPNKSLNYIKVNLGVGVTSSKTEENMKKAIDEYVSEDASEEIVSTFVKVMNAILESVESELGLAKISKANVDEGLDNTKYATLKTLQNMKLIEKLPDYTKPRDTNNDDDDDNDDRRTPGNSPNNDTQENNENDDDNDTIIVNNEDVAQAPVDPKKELESEKLNAAKDLMKILSKQTTKQATESVKTMIYELTIEMNELNVNSYEAIYLQRCGRSCRRASWKARFNFR